MKLYKLKGVNIMADKFYKPHESTRYVNKEKSMNSRPLPILYEKRENCCGCTACYAICSMHAITMESDEEGFLYPVVDAEACIRCYRCISVCAFKIDQEARGYIVRGHVYHE